MKSGLDIPKLREKFDAFLNALTKEDMEQWINDYRKRVKHERMTQLSIDGEPTDNPRLMTREEREEHKRLLRRETEARAEWRKYLKGKEDANARHREQTRKANAAWRKARGIFNHRESSCWLIGGTERPNPEQWP